jgi:hypothetical protein
MHFWSTSESSDDVSRAFFSKIGYEGAMMALERHINQHLAAVDGGEWQKWRVIFMIAKYDHQVALGMRETRRLTRKDMTLDFRVFADYEAAKHADFNQAIDLLVPPLERTLPYFSKAGVGKDKQAQICEILYVAAAMAKAEKQSRH